MNNTQALVFLLCVIGLLYSGRIIKAARYFWWASVSSSHQFRVRDFSEPLPACQIRLLTERDHESCRAIYQLNEAGHFPVGYEDYFAEWLAGKKSLVIAIEAEGRLVAFGGINALQRKWLNLALLSFGMVHPDYHRKGFGTILLFARLALLPTTVVPWQVLLSPGLTSASFYNQFGFRFVSRDRDHRGRESDTLGAALRSVQRAGIDSALSIISTLPEVREAAIPPVAALVSDRKETDVSQKRNPSSEMHS
jgi:GNAT superfamily N-acetyltransferase